MALDKIINTIKLSQTNTINELNYIFIMLIILCTRANLAYYTRSCRYTGRIDSSIACAVNETTEFNQHLILRCRLYVYVFEACM